MKLSRHTRHAIVRALQNDKDYMQEVFIEALMKMGLSPDEIESFQMEAAKRPKRDITYHNWRLQ